MKRLLLGGAKVLADRPYATEELASIAVPTLVLVGQDDGFHIVPGAAHAPIVETPGIAAP